MPMPMPVCRCAGVQVKDICRQAGISVPADYRWQNQYGGLNASKLQRVKEIEAENTRLKRLYAELLPDIAVLKGVISRKFQSRLNSLKRCMC